MLDFSLAPPEFKLNGAHVLYTEVEAKAADLKDNRGRGRAAGIGNMDRGGDVIAPGAFNSVGKDFKKSGEILIGHDWSGAAGVATVEACGEVGDSYEIEWEFYSTPDAQQCRQKLIERTERGKTTGLSIGFQVDPEAVLYFATGEELHAHCKKEGVKVDPATCRAWKGYCRLIMKIKSLFETSIVTVPMNARAYATAVKDLMGGDGSQVPATLEDHLETVLAAVTGMTARLKRYHDTKAADKRQVSEERMADAESLLSAFSDLVQAMKIEPQAKEADSQGLELLKLRARRLAIA